eukprot:7071236-Pyramimonas_sp.AAC.1
MVPNGARYRSGTVPYTRPPADKGERSVHWEGNATIGNGTIFCEVTFGMSYELYGGGQESQ